MIHVKIKSWPQPRELLDDKLQDSGSAREKPWNVGDVRESGEKFQFHI